MKLADLFRYLLIVIVLASCARHSSLLSPYRSPGSSPADEWGIHDTKVEWWYITGTLIDEQGQLYFFQFTIFHGIRHNFRGIVTHLGLTDFSSGKHYFIDKKQAPSKNLKLDDGNILSNEHSTIALEKDRMKLKTSIDSILFDLEFDIIGREVWHGEDGIISMGGLSDPEESSYYFSFPNMNVKGNISFPGENGSLKNAKIIDGEAWFDKQWGNFSAQAWQWFSIRLDSGDRGMFFHFPDTDYKYGTFIQNDTVITFENFEIISFPLQGNDDVIGLSWELVNPEDGQKYQIQPYLQTPFNHTKTGMVYWEGLCTVIDSLDNKIGWCVTEVAGPF